MDSIDRKNSDFRIFAAAAGSEDNICIALRQVSSEIDESVVLVRQDGLAQPWDKFVVTGEIVGVCVAPGSERDCEYVALLAHGEVVFLSDPPRIESIYQNSESEVYRYFYAISFIDNTLFALGANSAVYMRQNSRWFPLSRERPIESSKSDEIVFTCVEKLTGETRFILGGHSVPDTKARKVRIAEALEAGDGSFINILDEKVRENYGTLWLLENNDWRKIELPTNDYIVALEVIDDKSFYAGIQEGKIFECTLNDEISEIFSSEREAYIRSIVKHEGKYVFVCSNGLYLFDGTDTAVFSLEDLKQPTELLDFYSFGDHAFLVGRYGIARYSGNLWKKVDIPLHLLNINQSE